jgi:cytochrome c-type biogenesis protein CcmE
MTNATLAKILLTGIVAVGGGGFLVYSSVGQAQHYMQVDQLVGGQIEKWKDNELKVHGKAIAGSIVEQVVGAKMQRTFLLETNGQKVRVFNAGPVPQTFGDNADVIALGQIVPAKDRQDLATAICDKAKSNPNGTGAAACPIVADAEQKWVVDASELSAKCPSRYEGTPNNKLDPTYR